MELPLTGFYRYDSLPISAAELVNFYVNVPEVITPSKKQLLIPSGIRTVTTAGSSYNRGMHTFLSYLYVVQGTGLYRIDQTIDAYGNATYSSTLVSGATLLPGTAPVIMADNGQEGGQMVIVVPESTSTKNAWVYDGATLTQVADADFDGPVADVNYIDGYFEYTKQNGQKIFISGLRDGTTYDPLDYTNSEVSPDYNVRSFILNNQLYVFGFDTIQGYQDVGGAGFPFQYIQGSVQSKGLASVYGVVGVNNSMFFVGGDHNEAPSIWQTDGGNIQKLSTIAIDMELARYSQSAISSCFTWNYSEAGAQFIAFTFPTEKTFVYDIKSQEWSTRESIDSTGATVPCRIASVGKAYGVLFVGDTLTNKIGILDRNTYTEFDDMVARRFVLPHIDNDGQPFSIDSIEVVANSGASQTTGTGSNPLISLSVSRDGGRTFNNAITRSFGRIGQYATRIIWNALGRVNREVCFKFEVSDPVPWAITKVEGNFD